MDRPSREKCIDGVPQVRSSDLRGDPAVIAELSLRVEDERFRRPTRVEQTSQRSIRVSNHRKRVPMLPCMGADLVGGLRPVAVDRDEQDPFRSVLPDEVAEGVVVVVRVRTERGPEDHHDRAMAVLCIDRGERVALEGRARESGNGVSNLERGRAAGEEQREKRDG